jgi:hypothetical protein
MFIGSILSKKLNLANFLLIIIASLAFNLPWNIVKYQAVSSSISKYPEGMSSFIFLKNDLSVFKTENEVSTKIQMTGAGILSTLGISDELSGTTFTGGIAGEHFLFASPKEIINRPCPFLYPGPELYVNEFNNKFKNTCYSNPLFKIFEKMNSMAQIFLPILNLSAFIISLFFILNRNSMILIIGVPPLLSQIPYWIGGYYGSRYGLPVIALTPLIVMFVLSKLIRKLRNKSPIFKYLKIFKPWST